MTKFILFADVQDRGIMRGLVDTTGPLEERVEMVRSFLVRSAGRHPEEFAEIDLIAIANGPQHRLFEETLTKHGLDNHAPLPDAAVTDLLQSLVGSHLVPAVLTASEDARAILATAFARPEDRSPEENGVLEAATAAALTLSAQVFELEDDPDTREFQCTLIGAILASLPHALASHGAAE